MKIKNKKGFSLLEVLSAIFVLSVGIVGVLSLITSSIRDSIDSRNHIIASELAQEGVELVRNVRDNNFFSGSAFDDINNGDGQCIDLASGTLISSCNNRLYYRNSPVAYLHGSGAGRTETKFHRKITVSNYNNYGIEGKLLISMVIWGGSSFPSKADCNSKAQCVYAEDVLTSWAESSSGGSSVPPPS